jgi:catechol 2,3-dioxygenase-like lactoylglutathione lyase family enzyme
LGFVPVSDRQDGGVRILTLARRYEHLDLRAAEDTTGSVTGSVTRKPGRLVILVDNVDDLVDRLAEQGALIEREPRDDDSTEFRVAFVRDPNGHVLELREPLGDLLRHSSGRER